VFRYYSLADRLPALYAAVALDPDTKLKYFELEWAEHPDWIALAKTKSQNLWESEYRSLPQYIDTTLESLASSSLLPSINRLSEPSNCSLLAPDDTLARWKQKKRARLTHDAIDQFDWFQITEEVEEVSDILLYWAARLKNARWTQLSHMALEIHSIAAMSAEVERVFSTSEVCCLKIWTCCICT